MNRKYLNYGIFLAIVAVVVGLAVNHSRHMRFLVHSMAGPDRSARVAAAQELVRGEQFMDAVTGDTVETRAKVVQALEDWGTKEAAKQAVAYLKDPDKPVRDRLLLALIRIGTRSEENLQEIVNGLKDGDGNVRKACVKALQILGQSREADVERVMPPDLPKEEVLTAWRERDQAVARSIVPKVVETIKKDGGARASGGDVLGGLPDQREESASALLPLLAEKDEGVRMGAADALGKVGSKSAVSALVKAMKEDTPPVRRVAIGAIALIADRSGEAALTEAIRNRDDDNEARAQAASGLGKIATPTAVQTLIKALNDYDLKLQVAAVDALARAGKPAIGPLLNTLKSADPRLRVRAAQALGAMSSPEANPGLIAALKDREAVVRRAAANALGFEGNAAAVEPLVALLDDRDGSVAEAAVDALARIGEPARAALARALSGSETAAFHAAQALAKQRQAAVPAIRQAAAQSQAARRWAVVALGDIGGPEAVEALRQYARSGDADTRAAAEQALKRLGVAQ